MLWLLTPKTPLLLQLVSLSWLVSNPSPSLHSALILMKLSGIVFPFLLSLLFACTSYDLGASFLICNPGHPFYCFVYCPLFPFVFSHVSWAPWGEAICLVPMSLFNVIFIFTKKKKDLPCLNFGTRPVAFVVLRLLVLAAWSVHALKLIYAV